MTEKLYDLDPRTVSFTARVTSCAEEGGRWAVELDRTAFFPEGGGQGADRGTLCGREVLDVQERDGRILHYLDGPVDPTAEAEGLVDWEVRFARMQIHTAEHMVSGTAHRLWGCENMGFHMTEREAVIDLDRELSREQLDTLQCRVNEAVWADLPVRILYPAAEELPGISFRQKKEIAGRVRLVEIPGVDVCACCAPHVERTGSVGAVLFTDEMRHRGGMRITMTAGRAALERILARERDARVLSRLFSAPGDGLVPAAESLLSELEDRKASLADRERRYAAARAASAPAGERTCLFEDAALSAPAMRQLAGAVLARGAAVAGVFAGEDGARRYVIASAGPDLRREAKAINNALRGRGGGGPEMIQGSCAASRQEIEAYFNVPAGKGEENER